MRRTSATYVARRFGDVLNRGESKGEAFGVERRGRAIATIAPAAVASGADVKALLRSHRVDSGWDEELHDLRTSLRTAPNSRAP